MNGEHNSSHMQNSTLLLLNKTEQNKTKQKRQTDNTI